MRTVHLISADPVSLEHALNGVLPVYARLRTWRQEMPPKWCLHRGDIVMLDMDSLTNDVSPQSVTASLASSHVVFVLNGRPLGLSWLPFVSRGLVQVAICQGSEQAAGYLPVVASLAALLRAPSHAEIATAVLEQERSLCELGDLVQVICESAWDVRRPSHLAAMTGLKAPGLLAICSSSGFVRVEHLLVAVRCAGVERLAVKYGYDLRLARSVLGIKDTANWRRQLRRARARSPWFTNRASEAFRVFWNEHSQ